MNNRGHRSDCKFIDNLGPACDCDGLPPPETSSSDDAYTALAKTFEGMGWTREALTDGVSFSRNAGGHLIRMTKVISGWGYVWMRGPCWTINESSGFGTALHCINDLWENVFRMYDREHEAMLKRATSGG